MISRRGLEPLLRGDAHRIARSRRCASDSAIRGLVIHLLCTFSAFRGDGTPAAARLCISRA